MANKKGIIHRLFKAVLWTFAGLTGMLLLVSVLLYVPFVQDFAKNIAVEKISSSTGMDVSLDKLRLKFPLKISLKKILISQAGDTMISASEADLHIAVLPLFSGRIKAKGADLENAFYRLNTPDSAVYLTARIDQFSTRTTSLTFNLSEINVGNTRLSGADVNMVIKDTITAEKADTAASKPMLIKASRLDLQNVNFHLRMMPQIDTLNVALNNAQIANLEFDTGRSLLNILSVAIDSVDARYILPSAEMLAEHKSRSQAVEPDDSVAKPTKESKPMEINIGKISLTNSRALYAVADAKPTKGLDLNYLQLSDIDVKLDSFYNRGSELRVPLTQLHAAERCGLELNASGLIEIDSAKIKASNIKINTNNSKIDLDAMLGSGDLARNLNVPIMLNAKATVSLHDVLMALPSIQPLVKGIAPTNVINLVAKAKGRSGLLDIDQLYAQIPSLAQVTLSGQIAEPLNPNTINGQLDIDGSIYAGANSLKGALLDKQLAKSISIPTMKVSGTVDYSPEQVGGNIDIATASGGELALDAAWKSTRQGYDIEAHSVHFPLQDILPELGISNLSLDLSAHGHGLDLTKPSTQAEALLDIKNVTINKQTLQNVTVQASLANSQLNAKVVSDNAPANINLSAQVNAVKSSYQWQLDGQIQNIDLKLLGLSDQTLSGHGDITSSGFYTPGSKEIDGMLMLSNVNLNLNNQNIIINRADADFSTADSLTKATISSDDLLLEAHALCGLDTLLNRVDRFSTILNSQISEKKIDVEQIQHSLPPLYLHLQSGSNNVLSRYLGSTSGIYYNDFELTALNDSLINISAQAHKLQSGSIKFDDISFTAHQHGRYLVYNLTADNQPGTFDDFAHVKIDGFVSDSRLSLMLDQHNIRNEQGFKLGVNAAVADSTITVHFVPQAPVIAYKNWKINSDNFVSYDLTHKHLDANLQLTTDSSSLSIFTEHPSVDDSIHAAEQEDVRVQLHNIVLQDWLSISPLSPPIKGSVDGNINLSWNQNQVAGKGTVGVTDLIYGNERVGTFLVGLNVATDPRTGTIRADASLQVDSVEVLTLKGNLNDSTARNPLLLDLTMIHFPLSVANPFISKNVAQLSGVLNGRMDLTGSLARPVLNGKLWFDSTAVNVAMTGTSYRFSPTPIDVDSSIVKFNDFKILGLNSNDLHVNGTVDLHKFNNIGVDLSLKAEDMQVVKRDYARGADVYGKAFVDIDARARGNLHFLNVDARLNVLPGTNVTYVLQKSQSQLTQKSTTDMVRFVSFADTAQVEKADTVNTSPMAVNLNAVLTISEGSTINVDITPNGTDKLSLQSNGTLTYQQSPFVQTGRLLGRLNIEKGFIHYSPPLMGQKKFDFLEGSYVSFNGNVLNPTLHILAKDELKANVTQEGQDSRLVKFDVMLNVGGTLNDMDLVFDLKCDDDITVENELASMSPTQRANQAMNMLLYGQYTGSNTKASSNLSGNPLFSFLESKINSWAASNIHGVDLSFGIDQYDKTADGTRSTTTSYSYKVSKTLFDDRFKIVIGGNYSTGDDADENLEQNLINDISLEYMLNRSGSMYIKVFRHTDFLNILEGEVTETGVGFVLKRKLNSLRDIFRFSSSKK